MIAALLVRFGLSSKLSQWAASLFLVLAIPALCALIYWAGSRAGYATRDKEFQDEELQLLAAERTSLLNLRLENDRLTLELMAANGRSETFYRTIRQDVPRVVKEFVYVPNQAGGECTFGDGFVRVWNAALFADLPDSAGNPAGDPTGSSAAGVSVSASEVLSNHVDNSQSCDAIRRRLSSLVQWHKEHAP